MKSIQMQCLGQHVGKYVEKERNIKPMHLHILDSDNLIVLSGPNG